jgi:crotonobetainyl-CoA:carnitine CoA-transferase CaiB-like acyl-CoA transferase
MGRPELADDPRFANHEARGRHQDEIEKIVADWAVLHDSGQVDALLNEAGVACGPIYDMADVFSDPLFRDREMLLRATDPDLGELTLPGVVPKLSATPGRVTWPGPIRPGAHNEEIFAGLLGLSQDDLRALRDAGVV